MTHSQRDDSSSHDQAVAESVVRIHYDNDIDDDDEHAGAGPEEERPLITQAPTIPGLTARSNLRSAGRAQEGSGHSLHTLQGPDPRGVLSRNEATATFSGGDKSKVKQWGEWCRNNGLHPRIVLIGDILGAIGSFLFGRYIFYDWVKGMLSKHPKFTALDEVIKDDAVGVFPGSCLGIWIGSLLKGLSGIDNPELEKKNMVILIMNGVFIVCSILTLSMFGKRSLRKALAKLDHHQRFHQGSQEPHDSDSSDDNEDEEHGHHPRAIDRIAERILERADADEDETVASTSPTSTSQTVTQASSPQISKNIPESLKETGFTRAEKWTFVGIAVVAFVNVSVCIPLYSHYANQDD
ncbi:hypothetical protein EC991_006424 [Linnemannia zychae]|nr:hypothetical protein EC991_006424 [Linnemannia zychae]